MAMGAAEPGSDIGKKATFVIEAMLAAWRLQVMPGSDVTVPVGPLG